VREVTTHHTSVVLTNKFTAPIIQDNTGQLKAKKFLTLSAYFYVNCFKQVIDTVKLCQHYFGFDPLSAMTEKRKKEIFDPF